MRWSNIIFGLYLLGCLAIAFFRLMAYLGYDERYSTTTLALIYAGLTFLYAGAIAVGLWLKKVKLGGTQRGKEGG